MKQSKLTKKKVLKAIRLSFLLTFGIAVVSTLIILFIKTLGDNYGPIGAVLGGHFVIFVVLAFAIAFHEADRP